jgi:hypothetical protein
MPELRILRLLPRFAVLVLLALLAGCSGVQTAYRHADLYLMWKANEYFDLDHPQEAVVKPVIESLLKWHRQSELPAYAAMLETVQSKIKSKVTVDDVRWLFDESRARTRVAILRSALAGAPVLATVTPKEIGNLNKQLTKDNEEFIDKYVRGAVDKQQARRVTRFIESTEYWVGSLNDAQKARIKQIVAESPTPYALQLTDRQRIQGEFIAVLNEKNSADALKTRLTDWIADWDNGRSPQYVEALKVANDQVVRMTMSVADTLTPAQREHAQKTLQSYIDTMKTLVAEAR